MEYRIRNAAPTDAHTIAKFNARMSEETEDAALDPAIIGAGVLRVLMDAGKGQYWVAESDGELIGQIMVTYEWSDWRNGYLWWIQGVYIHPDFRRRGVFSALYRHVESLAVGEPDVRGIRLYVERDNMRAQQTYKSLGMVDPDYRVMQSLFTEES